MPNLEHTYLDYDLALLRAIASQAGVELNAPNARAAAADLAAALQRRETVEVLLARALGSDPRAAEIQKALNGLLQASGRMTVAAFVRRHGEPRPLGAAALARERPWENPANATEALYFNGLVGRAFMDSDAGPQEYFFIPSDLIPNLPPAPPASPITPAQAVAPPAGGGEDSLRAASSALVDDAVTLLAAIQLRPGRVPAVESLTDHLRLPAYDLLLALLADLQLITPARKLDPDRVRPFLQSSRADQLRALAEAWRGSSAWNDLLHVPTLHAEAGAWRNDPVAARALVIRLCAELPPGEWRSVESFVGFVREHYPDFQRPAGDYDSWYIRDADSGEYLRGFEHWDRVDGALVRFLIVGPMHWLGLTDVRYSPDAFRLTPIFPAFVGQREWSIAEKPQKIVLRPDAALQVSRAVNRYDRFQAARIGEWEQSRERDTYVYRLGGGSLEAAARQGITAKHVAAFLRRACEPPLPPAVLDAVERWGAKGIEVRAARTLILRAAHADVLELLRRSPKTKHYLGEAIGDLAVEVKNWDKLREAMVELGIFAQIVGDR